MKKLIVAVMIASASLSAVAQTSKKDCENFGDIVGSMQDIRNKGGSINLAFNDLKNLVNSKVALERDYGKSLSETAEYIWSKPRDNMTESRAAVVGTMVCEKKYR